MKQICFTNGLPSSQHGGGFQPSDPPQKPSCLAGCSQYLEGLAESVFFISIAIVIGPTPPGTGVMAAQRLGIKREPRMDADGHGWKRLDDSSY